MALNLVLLFSMFWGNEPGIGQECLGCEDPIYGTIYFPIIQIGSADELNFIDHKGVLLCKDCFQQVEENGNA